MKRSDPPDPQQDWAGAAVGLAPRPVPQAYDIERTRGRDRSADGFANRVESWALTHLPGVWGFINGTPALASIANQLVIDRAVGKAPMRPLPYGTGQPYTTWDTLTDAHWYARYLPEARVYNDELQAEGPSLDRLVELFDRGTKPETLSLKSTGLFAAFAQWFTDGFLLTDEHNRRKTRSSHHLDLSPLYGHTAAQQRCLRRLSEDPIHRGKLKTQTLALASGAQEDFAPLRFDPVSGSLDPAFDALPLPERLETTWPDPKRKTIFAFGGERANATVFTAAINTLFLRMHNRVCDRLVQAEPAWDDERVFQTARNVMIVLLIKIVVEEYINHIAPYPLHFRADPRVARRARWCRTNRIPVEFNLLYRWHALVPSQFTVQGQALPSPQLLLDNTLLLTHGLAEVLRVASAEPAGALMLHNTPDFLLRVEAASLRQSREIGLDSYNAYREAFGFPKATRFEQVTSDPALARELAQRYGSVDRMEFFVGLFAEDLRINAALPPLMGRMVAVDAFSHALANPLLGPSTFHAQTFSQTGLALLAQPWTLSALLGEGGADPGITMTRPGWAPASPMPL